MPNTPDDHFRGLPQVLFSTKTIEGEAGLYPHPLPCKETLRPDTTPAP